MHLLETNYNGFHVGTPDKSYSINNLKANTLLNKYYKQRLLRENHSLGSQTAAEALDALNSENRVNYKEIRDVNEAPILGQEFKDKISKTFAIDEVSFAESNTNKNEALSALEVLGFNRKQSEKVIDKILYSFALISNLFD